MRAPAVYLALERTVLIALVIAAEFFVVGFVGASPVEPNIDSTAALQPAAFTDRSLNWSGYVADSGDFTAISGSWVVPAVASEGGIAADATWVGIGGIANRNLIQAGTQAVVNEHGSVEYQAWIEGLPGESVEVPLEVHAGDAVTVELTEKVAGEWNIALHNNSTGKNYETTVPYHSVHSSAEWIEEMPSGNIFLPLDNFNRVDFTAASAVQNGKRVTPKEAGAHALTMVNGTGDTLAVPSVLAESGEAFRVLRSPAPAVATTRQSMERMSIN